MIIRLTTEQTGGAFAMIEMHHPPAVGPALHVHPRGPEAFYVLEGHYTFFRGEEVIPASVGDGVVIPAGVPHRYRVGPTGGRALVITPPGLERYFRTIAGRLASGPVPPPKEFAIAASEGQNFLDHAGHWEPL